MTIHAQPQPGPAHAPAAQQAPAPVEPPVPSAPKPPVWQTRWVLASVAFLAGALAGGALVKATLPASQEVPASASSITDAAASCGVTAEADGKSIALRTKGGKRGGSHTAEQVACVLRTTGAPSHVLNRVAETRALDGMQTATWGSVEASWTYHPDSGLFVSVAEAPAS